MKQKLTNMEQIAIMSREPPSAYANRQKEEFKEHERPFEVPKGYSKAGDRKRSGQQE